LSTLIFNLLFYLFFIFNLLYYPNTRGWRVEGPVEIDASKKKEYKITSHVFGSRIQRTLMYFIDDTILRERDGSPAGSG